MNKVDSLLKEVSLRVTPVRSGVLQLLLNNDFALSLQEIDNDIKVDRVTLYRTLKSFEQKGLIHKVIDGTGVDKYAVCEHHCTEDHHHDEHVHFNCDHCGNTFCIEDSTMPHITMPKGFVAHDINIIVRGICERCS